MSAKSKKKQTPGAFGKQGKVGGKPLQTVATRKHQHKGHPQKNPGKNKHFAATEPTTQ